MTYLKDYYIYNGVLYVTLSNDGNLTKDELYNYITRYDSMYERVLINDPENISYKFSFVFDKPLGVCKGEKHGQKCC